MAHKMVLAWFKTWFQKINIPHGQVLQTNEVSFEQLEALTSLEVEIAQTLLLNGWNMDLV